MTAEHGQSFAPGATLGILGGGQLGRMLAMAAARLGYHCHIYCPDEDAPAIEVAGHHTIGAYDDLARLSAFARQVDAVTFEFENIPVAPLRDLDRLVPLRPRLDVLAICQDRILEKKWLSDLGVPVAPYREVHDVADLTSALQEWNTPAILKTARLGYDGKGQARIAASGDLAMARDILRAGPAVLERQIDFDCEISVLVARDLQGATAVYPPVKNWHEQGILRRTEAPAAIFLETVVEAESLARRIANHLQIVGLLAVEMFVTEDLEVLVNELAPRPHNSGHWTLDACTPDQFEQTVRAVMGLPLGEPALHARAIMTNLLGDEVDQWRTILAEPGSVLHLYGKRAARPGRKMGHVTRLLPLDE